MNRSDKINFARFLISVSILLISVGISFDLEKKTVYIPKEKTYILTAIDVSSPISITTVDSDDIKVQSRGNYNSNDKVNIVSDKSLTIDDMNNNLVKSIKNNYLVDVLYGNDILGYNVGGLSTIPVTDKNVINQALNNLNYSMSLYPKNFFRELNKKGYPLKIYLIKNYSENNVTGITDSTTNNIVISIALDYSFSESFNHEVYHYIEKHINNFGYKFVSWNSLNPLGFVYGKSDNLLSYNYTQIPKSYFVNKYAQTDESEDRASTFEYMMLSSNSSCFSVDGPIKKKSRIISEAIDIVMDSVSSNSVEYWERYIY